MTSVAMASSCRVMLVVGTSGVVYPAARIPEIGAQNNSIVIEVNPERSPIAPLASVHIPHKSATALRRLHGMI